MSDDTNQPTGEGSAMTFPPGNANDPLLVAARDLLRQQNLPQAELYARQHIAAVGPNAAASAVLQEIRHGYGFSASFALSERSRPPSTGPRFLLIKAWGYGFFSEVHHLASQLLLAELTGRTPIILWGKNCLFRNANDVSAFGHFYHEVAPARLEDVPRSATIYPAKWTWENLLEENVNKWEGEGSRLAAQYLMDRPETLVVSDFFSTLTSIIPWIGPTSRYYGRSDDDLYAELFQRCFPPRADIAAATDEFFAQQMQGRPWVAVHIRGSDKIFESPNLAHTYATYFGFIDRIIALNPGIGVFLLTDSVPVIAEFNTRYGTRLLCTEAIRSASNVGVHHMKNQDGVAVGREVLRDALLAIKCGYFVGNKESNVSLAITSMRDWPPGFMFLLGEKSGRTDNSFLHQREQPKPRSIACRLCHAPAHLAFSREVLCRLPAAYFRCTGCGSLQTEPPYWLDEAYSASSDQFDTGKASRTLVNFLLVRPLLEILGVRPSDRCADFGGGTGLFARLMRDLGYNFFSFDKYGDSEFCAAHRWTTFDRPVKLVTIFECAEHFADPAAEWQTIFATEPDFILGSTGIYTDQGADWPYLCPETGQHIFFHSAAAIALIASNRGWNAYLFGGYFLMTRSPLAASTLANVTEWLTNPGRASDATFRAWSSGPFTCATTDNRRANSRASLRRRPARIAIDGVFFRFNTGISRLWRQLLAEWSANGFGEFLVVIDREGTAPRHAGIRYINAPQHDYTARQADRQMLQEICDREGISLFISTYYTTPLTTRAALLVPDMIPEVMGFNLASEQWREKHQAIQYCRHFLVISHSTARDLVRFFPSIDPNHVVTAYCGTDFRRPSTEQVAQFKARYGIDRPYFLISGVKTDYKNALLFFKAFAQLGDQRAAYSIVCTNSAPTLEPEFHACVGNARVLLGVLPDSDLQCAFAGATALAYPSRYEGFGLPVLEAMACACPVITCNNSSIAEVGGDAVIYVDPDDVAAMHEALRTVQTEPLRSDLIARGLQRSQRFTWRQMADTVEDALTRWSE